MDGNSFDTLIRTHFEPLPPGELAAMRLGLKECQGRLAASLSWLLWLPFVSAAPRYLDQQRSVATPGAGTDGKSA